MSKAFWVILAVVLIFSMILSPQSAQADSSAALTSTPPVILPSGSQAEDTGATPIANGEQPAIIPASELKSIPEKRADLIAKGAVEDMSQRNAYCEVFQKPDGTNTAIISSAPINYKAPDGSFQHIDNSLVPGSEPGTLVNKANAFSVRLPGGPETSASDILIRTQSGHEITIKKEVKLQSLNREKTLALLQEGKTGQGTVSENTITYSGLFPGIDEEYLVSSSGIKHNYIINQPISGLEKRAGEQLAFTEEIVLPPGSRLAVEDVVQEGAFETDKDILLLDADGKMIGGFAPPIAYDGRTQLPDPKIEDLLDLSYRVEYINDNTVSISVLTPVDWLNAPERLYPITIDPWFYESYWYDDGFQMDWSNMDYSYPYMLVGQSAYGPPFYMAYMMWRGIPIPRGSTINYVTFFFTPFASYSYDNVCSWEWAFEYTANAQPCAYQLPSTRTYSYWYDSWFNYNGQWWAGSQIGMGLNPMGLQEIVNRGDWNPGQNIGLRWGLIPYSNYRLIYSRDYSEYYAPQLYIDYQIPPPPLPPTNVQATDGDYTTTQITWSESYGATHYNLYRNTVNSPPAYPFGSTALLGYVDNTSDPSKLYYYWVTACNGPSESTYSNYNIGWREGDDINNLEVGAFWVTVYDEAGWLPNSDLIASGFVNALTGVGWSQAFLKGDDETGQVIQADFQNNPDNPNASPDGVDIFWFAGHGEAGTLILRHDWGPLIPDRVCYDDVEWGDNDVEWIFLHACETLYDDGTADPYVGVLKTEGEFSQSLNGCHMICGAHTILNDVRYDGERVGNRLVDSDGGGPDVANVVRLAWFEGLDETYGSGYCLRIDAEDASYWNEYIPGQGSGPAPDVPVDNYYVSWTYYCN